MAEGTMIHDTVLDTIGLTPVVRINWMATPSSAELVAKLEFFNPGGSVKDRVALSMIEGAERSGAISPGDVVVEPTSGNTGIGLAMVCAVRGYRIILTMPASMSVERRALLSHLGAELVLTPAEKGMSGAVEEAELLARENGHFMPRQFENPANPDAHARTTALEIVEALEGRELDFFVAGVGTGGTVSGAGRTLKEHYPGLTVVAVEPASSPVLSGGDPGPHSIEGLGAGFVPANFDAATVDEIMAVTDEDALATARRLAREEGILAGISSGASMFAALGVARRAGEGRLVLVVLPDTAGRYMSTRLFEERE
jgi:cysteine synthase A